SGSAGRDPAASLCARARRGCGFPARGRFRCGDRGSDGRQGMGRSLRRSEGSVWSHLVHRHRAEGSTGDAMKQKGKRSSASVRKARPATRRTPRTRKPAIAPVPAQARGATPYLMVNDAARALEFYRTAFDAVEVVRLTAPEGRVAHAEIRIGDSTIFVSDEWPGVGVSSPQSLGGSPVVIHLEVEDVDAV